MMVVINRSFPGDGLLIAQVNRDTGIDQFGDGNCSFAIKSNGNSFIPMAPA
jgi:hypothetical protein